MFFLIMSDPRRWPVPWVFSVLILPLGVYTGFITTPLPFLLSKAGVPVDGIAQLGALLQLVPMFLFLWTPVVDIKMRRRTWLLLGASAGGACLWVACPLMGASHLMSLTAVLVAGGMVVALVAASCGGLMATMLSPEAQPRASGWNQAGQLGGGAIGAALVLWLAQHVSLAWVGLTVAVLAALPSLMALTIVEPAPESSPWFGGRLGRIGREGLTLLRAPQRRWSALLLVAPCCTGAAQGLLPAIASHYGIGATGVIWANGLGGGAVLAMGALGAALVPGRWDRRLTYVGAGMSNALAATVLLAANRPSVYIAGSLLYQLTTGFCWARFVALALEVIGPGNPDAGTWYSLLTSAGTLPVACMIWLDGQGFHRFGTHGLLWTDAAANILVFAVVAVIFLTNRLGLRRKSTPQTGGKLLV
jgi:PAT family beta-lactamase induction signal transducer AmpG